jgi:hypothetical protein
MNDQYSIEILDEAISESSKWLLVKIYMHSKKNRSKLLYDLINNENVEGLMELWGEGSIIY